MSSCLFLPRTTGRAEQAAEQPGAFDALVPKVVVEDYVDMLCLLRQPAQRRALCAALRLGRAGGALRRRRGQARLALDQGVDNASQYVGHLASEEYGSEIEKLRDRYYRFHDSLFAAYVRARPRMVQKQG
jgi:hypothetical protein